MKDQHLKFLLKFHKPTSRHLYTLRYSGAVLTHPLFLPHILRGF